MDEKTQDILRQIQRKLLDNNTTRRERIEALAAMRHASRTDLLKILDAMRTINATQGVDNDWGETC